MNSKAMQVKVRACKLLGAQSFRIHLSDPSISARSTSVSNEVPNISHIPEEYHNYADVFSKAKADTLAPHCPYDLQINLEEGASPLVGAVYSLSQSKLVALREFIDEHVRIGFIRPPTPLMELRCCSSVRKTNHSVSVSISMG